MTDFKAELKSIYDKKVVEYKKSFDNSGGLLAMANNVDQFIKIIQVLADELTDKSNLILSDNDNISKDELTEYSKELVLKFRDKKLNPF
jgi:hypothetical protein